jgi:ABC-type phosphate transport system substrate-binding protein
MSLDGPSRIRRWIFAGSTLALSAVVPASAGEARYWVIVHPDNPMNSLDRSEVSRLFLKKSTRWKDGATAVPVDLVETAPARDAFSRDIHHRRAALIKKYWQQRVFSGQAAPPPEVATEQDVLAFVRAEPAAIGYVSDEAVLHGVKILDVTDPKPVKAPSRARRSGSIERRR